MSELKCKECGAELEIGARECKVCGCPVDEVLNKPVIQVRPSAPRANTKGAVLKRINVMSIVSLILGIVIIAMGMAVIDESVTVDTYSAKKYSVDSASFGGDFYTYVYGASDTIVDELSDINGGIQTLSETMATMANVIYYPIGMLIISLGIAVIAFSFNHLIKENA